MDETIWHAAMAWADEHREDIHAPGRPWWVGVTDVAVFATRARADRCGLCGQPIRPYGPVTWVERGEVRGSYNHQHGCGQWEGPAEWNLPVEELEDAADGAPDAYAAVRNRLDAWWADVQAQYDADMAVERDALASRLRRDLDSAVEDLDSGMALSELATGSETEPGVYATIDAWGQSIPGRLWAWDYDPDGSGDTVAVDTPLRPGWALSDLRAYAVTVEGYGDLDVAVVDGGGDVLARRVLDSGPMDEAAVDAWLHAEGFRRLDDWSPAEHGAVAYVEESR